MSRGNPPCREWRLLQRGGSLPGITLENPAEEPACARRSEFALEAEENHLLHDLRRPELADAEHAVLALFVAIVV